MSSKGIGMLARIDGHMDAQCYVELLKEGFMGSLDQYGQNKRDVIFQHDNDPKHTAACTKK